MSGAPEAGPRQILTLNAFDPLSAPALGGVVGESVRRRAAVLGPDAMLFYDRPLELVRGAGAYLYDAAGTAYLDAYNNVPSVGHCHPHVVAAVARQLGAVNTHNRYLHPAILAYAERLVGLLPVGLSNLTFTCTGSESNDLALRLARCATGAAGFIVTEAAYHGNTALVTEVSPTLRKDGVPAAFVRTVPAPSEPDAFAAHVQAAILDLQRAGVGCAALLLDSIFSSDGVYAEPPGFLRAAVDAVHAVGGLFIADEVQCGFARTGEAFFGFARHGVTPDVVTMGKPMGNGYPVGAVATRPDILAAYHARFGYFNTFGGSPAAAAAGAAVLDVIEQEGLMARARAVGTTLRTALIDLKRRHAVMAAVRGVGLYLGVELQAVDADAQGPRAAAAAKLVQAVINGLRQRRVLIGAAGKEGHVLKIRPPLCFSEANAVELVEALDAVLLGLG